MRKLSLSSKMVLTKLGLVAVIGVVTLSCDKFGGRGSSDRDSGAEVTRGLLVDMNCFPEEIYAANVCGIDLEATMAIGVSISESSSTFPKTVTFDYGTGCADHWGRTRKGKVIVDVSGDMSIQGNTTSVSFDAFSVNDVSIEGSRSSENIGENSSGNSVVQYSGEITFSRGDRSRVHSFTNQREWVNGFSTCEVEDDEFFITGTGSMTTCSEKVVNISITEAIHYKMRECEFPLKGKVDVGSDKRGVLLNFGEGECDNIAEITIKRKNKTHQINLETREIIE